jgi:hypothetical protein
MVRDVAVTLRADARQYRQLLWWKAKTFESPFTTIRLMPILLILKQDDGKNKGRLKAFQTAFVSGMQE